MGAVTSWRDHLKACESCVAAAFCDEGIPLKNAAREERNRQAAERHVRTAFLAYTQERPYREQMKWAGRFG